MSKQDFHQRVAEHSKAGDALKNEMTKELTSKMRHVIQNNYALDTLDFEQAESDDECGKGVDFRSLFGNDHSFFINGDDSKDSIVGVVWDEEAGIAMLARQCDEGEVYCDLHPAHEELQPSDTLEALRLLTEWMNQGL